MRSPPPLFERSFWWIIFGNESRAMSLSFIWLSRCVSVTTNIWKSFKEVSRISILFLILRILILHNEIHLSVWLFSEIDCDNSCGPGLDTIFPTSSIKWSVKSKNNAFTFGFRPWRKRRQIKKREHRRLVLNMFK
jgi:hypothetical protein